MIVYLVVFVVAGALVGLGGLAMMNIGVVAVKPEPVGNTEVSHVRTQRPVDCHPWELNTAHANYKPKEDC